MKQLVFVISVVFFALTAQPASAAGRDFQPAYNVGGVGCPYSDVDLCFHEGDWWTTTYSYHTPFTACSLSGGCWSCLANINGKNICVYGTSAGGCDCSDVPRAGAGPGITDCFATGSCSFRSTP